MKIQARLSCAADQFRPVHAAKDAQGHIESTSKINSKVNK